MLNIKVLKLQAIHSEGVYLFERQVRIYMHAHTTITLFMHDLDIACKNVLISHNFMMHAHACCTCNLISTCTMFPLTLAKEPHYSDDLT